MSSNVLFLQVIKIVNNIVSSSELVRQIPANLSTSDDIFGGNFNARQIATTTRLLRFLVSPFWYLSIA